MNENFSARNRAITNLMIIAFVGGVGGVMWAFGLYGYNELDFSKLEVMIITGLGAAFTFASMLPAPGAIWTYIDAKGEAAPPELEQEPQPPQAESYLNFQSHQPGLMRIERRDGETITRGKIGLKRRQWRALVDELEKHRRGGVVGWSRRKIENHNMPQIEGTDGDCFIGLTARNEDGLTKFKALTIEMQRMGIVSRAGDMVLDTGWVELCRLAFGDSGIVI